MLVPIKHEKIYTIIIDQITELIKDRNLKPGDKLPSERELAQALSVSRASVRQAISAIAAKGMITVKQGDGTYVAEPSESNPSMQDLIINSLGDNLASQQINPVEIAEARRFLESEVARLCAIHAGEDICNKLQEILDETIPKIETSTDSNFFYTQNVKLHQLIAVGSQNKVYEIFTSSFIQLMNGNLWCWGKDHATNKMYHRKVNWQEHIELVDAIKNHDSERARDIMYKHMSSVVNEMGEIFNQNQQEE